MSKKKLFSTFLALSICGIFFGCSATSASNSNNTDTTSESKIDVDTFVILKSDNIKNSVIHQYILYDPDTLVMYTVLDWQSDKIITVLYNPDGTPRIYNPNEKTE